VVAPNLDQANRSAWIVFYVTVHEPG
jgi:hypothetical protein